MTEEKRIEKIKDRVTLATAGELTVAEFRGPRVVTLSPGHEVHNDDVLICYVPADMTPSLPDAKLFANARTDLNFLLGVIAQRDAILNDVADLERDAYQGARKMEELRRVLREIADTRFDDRTNAQGLDYLRHIAREALKNET